MKITELKCSACDGTLKIDEKNPNMAVCEYCHMKYMIEWAHPGVAGQEDVYLKKMPERIVYQPIQERAAQTDQDTAMWKKGIAIAGVLLICLGGAFGPGMYRKWQAGQEAQAGKLGDDILSGAPGVAAGGAGGAGTSGTESVQEKLRPEGLLAEFVERVFEKPVEDISESELAKIQWLELRTTIDFRKVGYSFEDPLTNPEAELTWIEFPRDDYSGADLSCLPAFSGLKRINAGQSLQAEDLEGLSITGISGYFDSVEEAAAVVEHPEELRYLEMIGSKISLQGIEQLTNLETLILDSEEIEEVKKLVSVKTLKSVTVDMYDGSTDFSTFGMMPWLETLSISSKNLRDLGFVSGMEGLKALRLEYGTFLTLAPLSDCPQLEELSVESCDELKDMSAVSGLTGLKKLALELPYDCPQPDLGGLTGMKELYLESFDETGFLKNMSGLEMLTLDSCNVSSASDLDGLTNLKVLKCTSFGVMERDYGFITHLTGLEEVDLHGTATYDDISGIFNLPALKRLNLSGMQCEINFDRIADNTTLEALSIDHIKLYKNVKVSGGGGIVYVDWDDVKLTDHLSFLEKLKGLKELSIKENELTDISFAASLGGLQTIDFSDNYVTDISPLSGLKALGVVKCEENPVSNYEILGDGVMIVR